MNRLFIFLLILTGGCYYDVEEDFITDDECSTDNVSYKNDILPILSNRCFKCHASALNLGNITLEGYDKLKIQIANGRLIGAVKRENGFSPMPQNEAKLPVCNIEMIEAWINSGAPNN